jgi:hypothetical protein
VRAIFDGKKGKRVDDAPAEGSKSKEPSRRTSEARRARSLATRHARKGTTTTRMKPSQSTRPKRALEQPLEARACSTTC